MHERNLGGNERRAWQMIAQHIENAEQRAAKGELAVGDRLARARPAARAHRTGRRGGRPPHSAASNNSAASAPRLQELDARLHRAVAASDWTEALAAAEAVLELAPQHTAARQARQRAWQAVGMEVTQAHRSAAAQVRTPGRQALQAALPAPTPTHKARRRIP